MDKRVEIYGTRTWAMNGKRGVVIDFHPFLANRMKDTYTVQLDGGEEARLCLAHVRAEASAAPPDNEEKDAHSQYMRGYELLKGLGVDVDVKRAVGLFANAAAQDHPEALVQLGVMHVDGVGVAKSWQRARNFLERAYELGCVHAIDELRQLRGGIRKVGTEQQGTASHHPNYVGVNTHALAIPSRSSPPSWTSGWKSTARVGRN